MLWVTCTDRSLWIWRGVEANALDRGKKVTYVQHETLDVMSFDQILYTLIRMSSQHQSFKSALDICSGN